MRWGRGVAVKGSECLPDVVADDILKELIMGLVSKRRVTRQELEEEDPQRPPIHRLIMANRQNHLRC